ncbi:MAG: class I SAM-dependent methyltransferase [Anaerolineae bacterium]|nr:class I SAM-dependent methyltransferase [Thermoflexales bacterium]MDW8408429.1 class I SAM-dependent methyltransferase [Anaerolineae bacterium]
MGTHGQDSFAAYDVLARYYDLQHARFVPDVPMYLQAAARFGRAGRARILELGCGTARVMAPLVEAGHYVLGVDASEAMLRYARQRLPPPSSARYDLLAADIADLGAIFAAAGSTRSAFLPFDLAIIALNTFLHNLSRESQLAALHASRILLRAGGCLIVDLPPNDELAYQPDAGDSGEFEFEAQLKDDLHRTIVDKYVHSRILWARQEQWLRYRFEERAEDTHELIRVETAGFRLRHVFKHEMELLLIAAGFTDWSWYGDYNLSEYGEGSPRMIVFTTT